MFENEILNAFVGGIAIVILGAIALKLLAWFLMPSEGELKEMTTLKKRMVGRENPIAKIRH